MLRKPTRRSQRQSGTGPDAAARPSRIADVARLAGVSTATVSRALANPATVAEPTRTRVLEAVREMRYTPNVVAQTLRTQRTMMVLVIVPDIANSFFAEILRGIDATLSANGYGLIIGNLGNVTAREARFVDLAFAAQVDGALILSGHMPSSKWLQLSDAAIPIVAACEAIPGTACPQVEIDNRSAARTAVAYLQSLGHRHIAYIGGPAGNILQVERRAGYRDAIAANAGEPAVEFPVEFPGDFSFAAGVAAATAFQSLKIKQRPTAVFAANDEMAIGFIKTVQDCGFNVPGDVSVIGFDDIAFAAFTTPALTTMRQPRFEIGEIAAGNLIGLMAGRTGEVAPLTRLNAELVVRTSTAPPKP